MKTRAAGLVALLLLAAGPPVTAAESVSGSGRALSGGVLIVRGAKVRLSGLAALPAGALCPAVERARPCRAVAQRALGGLVAGREITCRLERKVGHGSFEGTCRTAESGDLGAALVRAGWARVGTSAGAPYRAAQTAARAAGRGFWGTEQ